VEKDEKIESGKRLVAGFVAAGAAQKMLLMRQRKSIISELRVNPEIKKP
jgi:hypothetical protein